MDRRERDRGNAAATGGDAEPGVTTGGRTTGDGATASGGAAASGGADDVSPGGASAGSTNVAGDATQGSGVELDPVEVNETPPPGCACGEGCIKPTCDVVTLSHTTSFVMNVFVRDEQAYVMGEPWLARLRMSSGGRSTITSDINIPSRVVVDGEFAYFASYVGLWRVPRDADDVHLSGPGSERARLLSTLVPWNRRLTEITVDSRDVYWTAPPGESGSARVTRTPVVGGASVTLARLSNEDDWPLGIAVDDTDVYFTSNARLQRVAKAGGEVQELATIGAHVGYDTPHPQLGLALDRAYVYFDSGTALRRQSKLTGASEVLFDVPEGDALSGVVVDADYAYFATKSGNIYQVSKLFGGAHLLVSGESNPLVSAIDAHSIYWVQQDTGQVLQLAK